MAKLVQCSSCKKHTIGNECEHYVLDDKECSEYELPYNNSQGLFKHPFSFEGRIGRLEYCMTYLLYWLYCLPMNLASEEEFWLGFAPLWILLLIPVGWITLAQGAKRCHDLGNNFLYQFIPFYILWMFFISGNKEVNRYGTSPAKSYDEQVYKGEAEVCNTEKIID